MNSVISGIANKGKPCVIAAVSAVDVFLQLLISYIAMSRVSAHRVDMAVCFVNAQSKSLV